MLRTIPAMVTGCGPLGLQNYLGKQWMVQPNKRSCPILPRAFDAAKFEVNVTAPHLQVHQATYRLVFAIRFYQSIRSEALLHTLG
jgi:hypothetical protein